MRKMIKPVFMVLVLSGCGYMNPYIRDFNVVPLSQEIEIGRQMEVEIAKQMTLVTDPAPNLLVNSLGHKLIQALPRRDFDYRFFVVEDKSPNAFAIPGGAIYVHTGLLSITTDRELAGVIAHEIGHVYARHPAKGLSRAYGLDFLAGLVLKGNESQLRSVTGKILQGQILNKYGRDDEREADDIGYYLLRRAGYSGNELLEFFRKLEKLTEGSSVPGFLSTHPPTAERIARLESLAKDKGEGSEVISG